jgi:site-specific recombinase XerD
MEDFEEVGMNWLQANRRRVAPKTTGRRLTSLKAFAKWAGWGDMFTEYSAPVPAKGVPHPLPEGIEGVYRLIDITHNVRQKALIALCGLCGCRVAEALAVKPSDFNLHDMTLTIRGKGDKTRIVPVSPRAWEILQIPVTRAFVDGDIPVIGLKDRFARRVISDLGVKAKLKRHISSHDLRATFATEVWDRTLDLRVVQELLGHASSNTTELYTAVRQDKMREAVNF